MRGDGEWRAVADSGTPVKLRCLVRLLFNLGRVGLGGRVREWAALALGSRPHIREELGQGGLGRVKGKRGKRWTDCWDNVTEPPRGGVRR
jgi:hypothetical protein